MCFNFEVLYDSLGSGTYVYLSFFLDSGWCSLCRLIRDLMLKRLPMGAMAMILMDIGKVLFADTRHTYIFIC